MAGFTRDLRLFERLVEARKDEVFRDATRRFASGVVSKSPIATGEFIGEWDIAVNRRPLDTERGPQPARATTRRRLHAVINTAQWGDVIHMINDDPIAAALEFGLSDQAPQGIIRISARAWRRYVIGAAAHARNSIRKQLGL